MNLRARLVLRPALVGSLLLVAACQGATGEPAPPPEASSTDDASLAEAARAGYSLVVLGDSLPYARQDCGGCTGFATLYGAMVEESVGRPTEVSNLSTHDGVTTPVLLERLRTDDSMRQVVSDADIVVISAGHNDTPWGVDDDTCDGPGGDDVDWSSYTPECATEAASAFGSVLDGLLTEVELLRDGAPTAVRVINFYNDWIGWADAPPEATVPTVQVLDAFSSVICKTSAARGAACADTYHAFNGADGTTAAGTLLAEDYTHPSATGQQRIAEVLFDLGVDPLS